MAKLTSWATSAGNLRPLFDVVSEEIVETAKKVKANPQNSPSDIARLDGELTELENDISIYSQLSPLADSGHGDVDFPMVYGVKTKNVDIFTRLPSGAFKFSECKFGIVAGGGRLFANPVDFVKHVAKKFDDDERLLVMDGEKFSSHRIVVVTDERYEACVFSFRNLCNCGYAAGACSTDGKKHVYLLCKCSSLRKLIDSSIVPKPDSANYKAFYV